MESLIFVKIPQGILNPWGFFHYDIYFTEEQQEKLYLAEDDNPFDLVYARAFIKESDDDSSDPIVRYFSPDKLRLSKYIILSATLNSNQYRRYFNDTMQVYEYPEKKAAYSGRLVQYTYHSLGRRDLSSKMDVFEYACKIAGNDDLEIITFMKLTEQPQKGRRIKIHFGKSSGIDEYKGHNLGIIGTPFSIDSTYKLIACSLGGNVNMKYDEQPRMRRIEHNGYSFVFMTYSDDLLREIQLYFIESELEQCIGRARLLRYGCTVPKP